MSEDLRYRLSQCATGLIIHGLGCSAIGDAMTELARLEAANAELVEACTIARAVALEAWEEWDQDHDSRVGKLLKAMSGFLKAYRADIDKFHAALAQSPHKAATAIET